MKKKFMSVMALVFCFCGMLFADTESNSATTGIGDVGKKTGEAFEEVVDQTKNFFHIDELKKYFTFENLVKVVIALLSIIIFYIVYRVIKHLVSKSSAKRFEVHTQVILKKLVSYIFYIFIALYILNMIGIDLKAIWGAAGIAGLAIGFAAQTSVSNLISGIFVLTDHTMRIGDFIEVSGVSGTVDNIGLLSVKIHTLDNQFIRIPNSTIINNDLINYSHFPNRRFVFEVPVSYDTDLKYAIDVLRSVPERCPTVLQDPAPSVFYDGFNEGITVKIAVWFKREDLIQTKNDMYIAIKEICKEKKVEIPFEHFDITIKEDRSQSADKFTNFSEK